MPASHYAQLIALSFVLFVSTSQAAWETNLGIELQTFTESAANANEFANDNIALSLEAEYQGTLGESGWQTTFTPFLRWDNTDEERNHVDLREAYVLKTVDNWVFQAGLAKVFWGVTESQHLVDIINQTDNLEGLDGEDKLGQAMIRLGYELEQGAIYFYLLPGFREREYLSQGNRFGPPLALSEQAQYESDQGKDHLDFALRWSGYRGPLDFGLSYFDGTARAPEFVPVDPSGTLFAAYYPQIQQYGIDAQYTGETWLWKLEAIHRRSQREQYNAVVAGFEYTFYGLYDGMLDLGLLMEHHLDSRDDPSRVFLQNELFIGSRFGFNDAQSSSILGGVFIDLDDDSTALRLEASRRIGDNMTIDFEAQAFSASTDGNLAQGFANNDFIKLELKRYF